MRFFFLIFFSFSSYAMPFNSSKVQDDCYHSKEGSLLVQDNSYKKLLYQLKKKDLRKRIKVRETGRSGQR